MYTITPISSTGFSHLHFNYRLFDVQEEIEIRTSYLGKFRKSETSSHLLDLIAMTRDESNLFSLLIKEVSSTVFDEFRKGVLNIGESWYAHKDGVSPIAVTLNPQSAFELYTSGAKVNGDGIDVSLQFLTRGLDVTNYTVIPRVEIVYEVSSHALGNPSIQFVTQKTIVFTIPHDEITNIPNTPRWLVRDYHVEPLLEDEYAMTSRETIQSVVSCRVIDYKTYKYNDTTFSKGDVLDINGETYELLHDTSLNNIDLSKDAIKLNPLDTNEGIHYYVNIPSWMQSPLIKQLDEVIQTALVYGVIWRWLLYTYPAEAEQYEKFFVSAKKEVYSKCNIFKRQYSKVSRIL